MIRLATAFVLASCGAVFSPSLPVPKPSHPATTAAQWTELESRAAKLSRQNTTHVEPPRRLQKIGTDVETTFDVDAQTCYAAGITWAFAGKASITIAFDTIDGMAQPNNAMVLTGATLKDREGVVEFCADNPGRVILRIEAITKEGFIAHGELLEYAVAIGARRETDDQTVARRLREKERVARAKAWRAANIAAADARARKNRSAQCNHCIDELKVCRASAVDRDPRDVSIKPTCEQEFRLCSFYGSRDRMERSPEWPCGRPPVEDEL